MKKCKHKYCEIKISDNAPVFCSNHNEFNNQTNKSSCCNAEVVSYGFNHGTGVMNYMCNECEQTYPVANEYNIVSIIDGCGIYFRTLVLHTQYRKKLLEPWEAVPNKKILPKAKSKKGKTAGEALYKLLIEINKNINQV